MDAKHECLKLFGNGLRDVRLRRGMTQAALSELASLHRHYVSDIERGARNPCLEAITRLAWALKAEPAELFSGFTADALRTLYDK